MTKANIKNLAHKLYPHDESSTRSANNRQQVKRAAYIKGFQDCESGKVYTT